MHVTSRIWNAQGPGMSWVRCRMSDRCGWWVGGEWGWGVGCVGHGWLWPAISNHGGSWLFMARHEQPLSQSGQNQTQAFKAPKPNGDISEKSHCAFPPRNFRAVLLCFVMFCCNLNVPPAQPFSVSLGNHMQVQDGSI